MSKRRIKEHLEQTKEILVGVLTKSLIVVVILGSSFLIHFTAEWLFKEPTCIEHVETIVTIQGVTGASRPGSIEFRTIEDRCKESR